jgi:hypothetical protein
MIDQKLSAVALLVALWAGSAGGCGAQGHGGGAQQPPSKTKPDKTTPAPSPHARETPVPTNIELKELAAGAYSSVHESFVLVARDTQTYAALRALVNDLPDQPADFFRKQAVVAAFLGQRRSGGYGVEIKQTGRTQVSVSEHAPPKDAMTTMALTAPFRVIALPLEMDESLALTLDATWRARLRPYQIAEGGLTVFGGFAGRQSPSRLEGGFGVMRLGELATFIFDVRSTGGERAGRLVDTATGSVSADGQVSLPRLDSFGLSGALESPLRAKGQFSAGEQNLTLSFEVVPAKNISDNFGARGQFTANATAPAPASKALNDEPM